MELNSNRNTRRRMSEVVELIGPGAISVVVREAEEGLTRTSLQRSKNPAKIQLGKKSATERNLVSTEFKDKTVVHQGEGGIIEEILTNGVVWSRTGNMAKAGDSTIPGWDG